MSELDADRRELLLGDLAAAEGQSVIASTDLAHVPGSDSASVVRLRVAGGKITVDDQSG
jgi:DNA replication and repair protein RecF